MIRLSAFALLSVVGFASAFPSHDLSKRADSVLPDEVLRNASLQFADVRQAAIETANNNSTSKCGADCTGFRQSLSVCHDHTSAGNSSGIEFMPDKCLCSASVYIPMSTCANCLGEKQWQETLEWRSTCAADGHDPASNAASSLAAQGGLAATLIAETASLLSLFPFLISSLIPPSATQSSSTVKPA